MVGNKSTRGRPRKAIETTLGRAPVKPKEKEKDISALRLPIETSVRGPKEIVALLKTGTDEIKDLISYQCDLMYECRICKSIFRCLSNFVLHKRKYCLDKFNPACDVAEAKFQIVGPSEEPASKISALDKIVERLREIESVSEAAKESLHEWNLDDFEDEAAFSHIVLEKIDSNDSGIFQTLVNGTFNKPKELTKAQVMENYKKLDNDVPVLDPEGKICGFTSNKLYKQSLFPKFNFPCDQCTQKFATRKSLYNHVKCIHNQSKGLYFCPLCRETLANPWSVYRHLLRVHKMTGKQVRKMRDQVTSSCVLRKDEDSIKIKKRAEPAQISKDSENQWIKDIEGDKDFQMCAGCGKRFERKAALHAHSQMCTKRMEVCNNIKENAKKKEEKSEKAKANKMPAEKKKITGALKRKRPTIYSCPRKRINLDAIIDENSTEIEGNLNQLENINVESSPILNEFTIETTTDVITQTESVNNVPQTIDDPQLIPLSDADALLLDHCQSNSDGCDVLEEVIDLTDDKAPELDLLSDAVSFEAFCDQLEMIQPNQNHLMNLLPGADNDIIFIEDDNEIAREMIEPMKIEQDDTEIQQAENSKIRENVPDVDQAKQEQLTDKTEELYIKASEEQAGTKSAKPEEDITKKKETFPRCALPFVVPLELLCIPCDRKFTTKDELHCHMSGHFSWFRFQCTKCSFVSFKKEDCIIHAQERHHLEQNAESRCIVPMPYWRSERIAHSYKPLKDRDCVVGGTFTDEDIGEEIMESNSADSMESVAKESSNSLFFGSLISKENSNDEDAGKKITQLAQSIIDVEEIIDDQLLPEPSEMSWPIVDSTTVSEASSFDKETEESELNKCLEYEGNGSSDDWGVPEVCVTPPKMMKKKVMVKKAMPEPVPKVRAVRMRTLKHNDDFLYYDTSTSLNELTRIANVPTTPKKKREK